MQATENNVKFNTRDKVVSKKKTDEEMVHLIQQGDIRCLDAMMNRYKDFVRAKARPYFLIGSDREDIIQEGMIGLYKAIRDYRTDKMSSFKTFADLCVTRQIITAVKASNRLKHTPLNTYISLNKPAYDEEKESGTTLLDLLTATKELNPENILIGQEDLHAIEKMLQKKLSELEKSVLKLYLDGRSYQNIAQELDKSVKSIDNALQRVKHKIENILKEKTLD